MGSLVLEMRLFLKNKKILIFFPIILINLFLLTMAYFYFYSTYKKNYASDQNWNALIYSGNKNDAFSLFYKHQSKTIFIYRLKPDIFIMEHDQYKPLFPNFDISDISHFLNRYFAMNIDFYIKIDEKDSLALLDILGGVNFFNLDSSFLPKGPVVINSKNIKPYISAIGDPQIQKDNSLNIAVNYLFQSFHFFNKISSQRFSNILYSRVKTNATKYAFRSTIDFMQKNYESVSILYNHINFNETLVNGKKINVILMDNRNIYDVQKVKAFYQIKESQNDSTFVEVVNTTNEKRLAAKASEFLKTKKITVAEFSNAKINLGHSTMLFRKLDSQKRDHLKKITDINSIYYLFNYYSNYDATILLAEQFKK